MTAKNKILLKTLKKIIPASVSKTKCGKNLDIIPKTASSDSPIIAVSMAEWNSANNNLSLNNI